MDIVYATIATAKKLTLNSTSIIYELGNMTNNFYFILNSNNSKIMCVWVCVCVVSQSRQKKSIN